MLRNMFEIELGYNLNSVYVANILHFCSINIYNTTRLY